MAVGPGSRIGPYEVTALLGEGGMGKVWRAHHTALKRDDALKVLPDAFASDPERLARFRREAQVLASLNHPNIAHVYGLEHAEGVQALVMELVDGPTLADRIARGPVPIDEALPVAKQIAEALETAHEQGIIHRDLKPANIKLRPDGVVKVLDFGLAKALSDDPGSDPSNSPTLSLAATRAGVILGTAAYMSPEQARGKTVDKRTDVWAFGCVVYEMLTGRRAFEDEDVSLTLSKVLQREPDYDALPDEVPGRVRQALRVCLRKDPKQRAGDIRDVRLAMEGAFETIVPAAAEPAGRASAAGRTRIAAYVTASLVLGGAMASAGFWLLPRSEPPRVVRTEVPTAGATALSIQGVDRDLAITPDGSRIVYRGDNQLLVRPLDRLTPTPLTGLANPRGVFIAPDGQWVGFFDSSNSLKKVAITGGPPVTVTTTTNSTGPRGATWGDDGTIVYATIELETGLQRVSAAGGEPTVLTTPDRDRGEQDHLWPEFLPGGQAVLFTITSATGSADNAQIAVLDLRTNAQTVLVRGGHHAHYVPSGHLVYAAGGTMRAVAFDLARLTVTGTPVPVVENVLTTNFGGLDAVVSANGTLVYVAGALASAARTLVWVDRQGREEPIKAPPRAYVYAQLSPDGTRVALDIRDQEQDIWIWDLVRGTLQRLTFDPGLNRVPVWSSDGRRVAFSRTLDNTEEVYWQSADGSGVAEPLTKGSKRAMGLGDFSPDGATLLFQPTGPPRDIWMVPVKGPPTAPVPLLNSPANEANPTVSPDGRWLAYESDESGQYEIYVRPFPEVNTGRWQISTGGGTRPRWSRNGRELFYYVGMGERGALMAVSVQLGSSFKAGSPTMLFQGSYPAPNTGRELYDVSLDGERFLMIKSAGADGGATPVRQIVVVQNWLEELRRLVPAN